MKSMTIHGGRPLSGTVSISGAKNAATKMMIASLLTDEPVILKNCPDIGDVEITAEICQHVGAKVTRDGSSLTVHAADIHVGTIHEQSRRNRISILALAPLLIRTGEALVPIVGGDAIGPRPVDFHLEALRSMGAEITETPEGYRATAPHGLHGARIHLPYPSVGATENSILAAVLARGNTVIKGAATEPEIIDLIKLLQQMGAIIELGANRRISIEGVERLHGATYSIMPDRLEAASYALVGLATDGEILVRGAQQEALMTFLNTIRRLGGDYVMEDDGIRFRRAGALRGVSIETDTYPGFATDWQQPMVVLLTQAQGQSQIHETVYEDRLGYTETLRRMGADIQLSQACLGELSCRLTDGHHWHSATITGPTALHATDIEIPDIRAGMAHILAALVATGDSHITGVDHLLRGYENLPEKLRSIGADFQTS